MISDKEIAVELIKKLRVDASLEEIAEELGALAAIRRGEQDADAGRTIPHVDVKAKLREWVGRRGAPRGPEGRAGDFRS
jgi:predicted transcriptional regulator